MKADKIHTYINHEHRVEADTEGAGPADGVQVTEETQGQSYTGTRQHDQRSTQVVCILQQPDQWKVKSSSWNICSVDIIHVLLQEIYELIQQELIQKIHWIAIEYLRYRGIGWGW